MRQFTSEELDRAATEAGMIFPPYVLDQLVAAPIAGTEGANAHHFFSPDGRWIGFHSGPRVMKVPVAGGRPVLLATLTSGEARGSSWAPDDTIVLARRSGGLVRVPADGGDPQTIVKPDDDREYWYPQVLPGGRRILFTASMPAAWWSSPAAAAASSSGAPRSSDGRSVTGAAGPRRPRAQAGSPSARASASARRVKSR